MLSSTASGGRSPLIISGIGAKVDGFKRALRDQIRHCGDERSKAEDATANAAGAVGQTNCAFDDGVGGDDSRTQVRIAE